MQLITPTPTTLYRKATTIAPTSPAPGVDGGHAEHRVLPLDLSRRPLCLHRWSEHVTSLEVAWMLHLHLYSCQGVVGFDCITRSSIPAAPDVGVHLSGSVYSTQTLDQLAQGIDCTARNKSGYDADDFSSPLSAEISYVPASSSETPHASQADVCLQVCRDQSTLQVKAVRLLCRRSCMGGGEAQRFARNLAHMLSACSAGPSTITVRQLATTMLSASDLPTVMGWNTARPLHAQHVAMHDRFSSIACRQPHLTAVRAPDGCMTYADLDKTSSAVAIDLLQRAGGPNMSSRWMGLLFHKSRWTIVAVLAVLKCGASCVLLDPSWPDKRLREVVRVTSSSCIMTNTDELVQRLANLALGHTIQVIDIAQVASAMKDAPIPPTLHRPPVTSVDDAFMIFTSGSTGEPKGVVLSHLNVCTSVLTLIKALNTNTSGLADHTSRVLQFASYAFDACLSDMLVGLLSGGTVCVPSEDTRNNDLQAYMVANQISLAFLTPTVARTLNPAVLRQTLRGLILIGEPVSSVDQNQWLDSGICIFNGYGPTECSFGASLGRLSHDKSSANIGHPLNYRFWVVNPGLAEENDDAWTSRYLVPVGAPGELCIEGPALARAYFHDALMTKSKFRAGPDWLPYIAGEVTAQRRVYRTGDLVKYCEDGSLECLGRVNGDTQVKVGGQRLELRDIELHISRAAAAESLQCRDIAACLPHAGIACGRLVVLLVRPVKFACKHADVFMSPCDEDVRQRCVRYLSDHVPPWMVPSIWLEASHIPTTSSGKRDHRKLLSALEALRPEHYLRIGGSPDTIAPPSPFIRHGDNPPHLNDLIEACCQILGLPIEIIAPARSFISFGGDSIAALQVMTRLRTSRGLRLTTKVLLTCPTLREASLGIEPIVALIAPGCTGGDSESWEQQALLASPVSHTITEAIFPCTPIQESLLLAQARFRQDVYMTSTVWKVTAVPSSGSGELVDLKLFQQAWSALVSLHAALRTVPAELPGTVTVFANVVLKESSSELSAEQIINVSDIAIMGSTPRCFPSTSLDGLGHRPPYQVRLFVDREGQLWVRLDASHVILDGLSIISLLKQWSAAYQCLRTGAKFLPTPSASRMPLYAALLTEPLREQSAQQYWKQYLHGVEPCIMPSLMDETISDGSPGHSYIQNVPVKPPQMMELQNSLSRHGITQATFFMAIWALVLRMYTHGGDIVFGYVSSGRDLAGAEIGSDDIGCFIAPLVARFRYDELEQLDSDKLLRLLKKVQCTMSASSSHQGMSLAQIEAAIPMAGGSRACNTFVSVMPSLEVKSSLRFETLQMISRTEFDISLVVTSGPDVSVALQCSASYIQPQHAQNLAHSVTYVIDQTSSVLQGNLQGGNIQISPEDTATIRGWNSCRIQPADTTIAHSIESSMKTFAKREAVCASDGCLTYEELDNASCALGRYLLAHYGKEGETEQGTRVILCFVPSTLSIIAQLAVWRSGGCVVMIDNKWHQSRIDRVLEDNSPGVLLYSPETESILDRLASTPGVVKEGISLQMLHNLAAGDVPGMPQRTIAHLTPEHLAYIIYTSGSSGRLKGAMMPHRAVVTHAKEHASKMRISMSTRTLLIATLTFDMAIENIYMTLLSGGCLCIPSEEDKHDITRLIRFAVSSGANWMACTPSFLSLLPPHALHMMDVVVLGGEAIPSSIIDSWTRLGGTECSRPVLMNGFGPSECALGCCVLNEQISTRVRGQCIGRGFRAITWIVADHDHDQLTPIGGVGELLLESPCLAVGYVGQSEVTSECFIDCPKWYKHLSTGQEAARFYKTGDLVRYGTDGQIFVVGRKDDQIKINGIRTEPSEVESILQAHLTPDLARVSNVVVCFLKDMRILAAFVHVEQRLAESSHGSGMVFSAEESLVAIVSSSPTHDAIVRCIRDRASQVPGHMMPQVFIPISALPITPSGKLHRRVLQQTVSTFDKETLLGIGKPRAPHNQIKTSAMSALAEAWSRILGVNIVDPADDFFFRGGNSLSAIALRAEVRKSMGMNLSITAMFEFPVLEDMVKQLERIDPQLAGPFAPFSLLSQDASNSGRDNEIMEQAARCCGGTVDPRDVEDVFPCTAMQETLMAATGRETDTETSDTQPYCMHALYKLSQDVEMDRMRSAWETVLRSCEILRSRIVILPEHGSVVIVTRTAPPVHVWQVTRSLDTDIDHHVNSTRFGYGTPLFVVNLVPGLEHNWLVLSAHHAVYDAWSLKLTWIAVMNTYMRSSAIQSMPPFRALIKHLEAQPAQSSADFWTERLSGCSAGHVFPQVPSGHRPVAHDNLTWRLSTPAPEAIRAARDSNISLDAICHAAWALVLALYSSSPVVSFGSTRTGRDANVPGIEGMLFPTMTTVPMQFRLDSLDTITAKSFLIAVKHDILAVVPHQHFGISRISQLSPQAKLACEFNSVLTVQAWEEQASIGDDSNSQLVSVRQPSIDPAITIVEPVFQSGFHPLPLALQIFSNHDVSHLTVEADYDSMCVSRWLLEHVLQQFDHIVSGLWRSLTFETPQPLSGLLRPPTSHLNELMEWSDFSTIDDVERAEPQLLFEPFERMAAAQPHAAALVSSDGQYTYDELNRAADQFAIEVHQRSQKLQCLEPSIVGFCFEHGPAAVVAMLAISKSGCALMPLSPLDADSRLKGLVQLSECALIVTSKLLAKRMRSMLDVEVLEIDENTPRSRAPGLRRQSDRCTQPRLAYVLFTSGSAGQGVSKGVMVEHEAATAAVVCLAAHWGLNRYTRRLQYTNYAFDNSIEDVFGTLSAGGCIIVPSESERSNDLIGFCRRHQVNSLHITPTVLNLFFANPLESGLTLQSLVIGGEPIKRTDLEVMRDWTSTCANLKAFVAYGSTETCIDCVARQIGPSESLAPANCIGFPIRPTLWRPLVISPLTGQLAPVGAQAELHIEGAALARGYLGQPESSSKHFTEMFRTGTLFSDVQDAQCSKPSRAFRTNDFVQYHSDASLLSLGRKDGQIKIHGKRIDVHLIESLVLEALRSEGLGCEGVQHTVVEAFDGHLHAVFIWPPKLNAEHEMIPVETQSYGCCRRLMGPLVGRLQQRLANVAPAFMIPEVFVAMETLYTTASGKCDRTRVRSILNSVRSQSLSSAADSSGNADQHQELTDTMALLRRWWATVLPRIGIPEQLRHNAHFFQLGAHSVAAVQLASLARSAGYRLRYEDIFGHPVLADMATTMLPLDPAASAVAPQARFRCLPQEKCRIILSDICEHYGIHEQAIDDVYPCTSLQEATMVATAKFPGTFIMAQKVPVPHHHPFAHVKAAFTDAFDTFETMRSCIVQVLSFNSSLMIVMKNEPEWEETQSAGDFLATARRLHDYGQPLVRLALAHRTSGDEAASVHGDIVLTAHHAAYDGPMLTSFWRHIDAFLTSSVSVVPAPLVPFRAFAHFINDSVDADVCPKWWCQQLDGYAEASNHFPPGAPLLPSIYGPLASRNCFRTVSLCQWHQRHTSVAIVARAAWSLVLSHYLASNDTVYGVVVDCAKPFIGQDNAIDLSKIAGPTNATIPSRTRIDFDAMSVSMLLSQVQQQSIEENRFAHLGLNKISTLSAACKTACQVSSIVVIHDTIDIDGTMNASEELTGCDFMARHKLGHSVIELEGQNDFTPHALVVSCHPVEASNGTFLRIHVLFDPNFVNAETCECVLDVFATLLRNMTECPPETILRTLSPLSEESKNLAHLISDRNDADPDVNHSFVHKLFSARAVLCQEQEAICSWDGTVTYRSLDYSSSELALALVQAISSTTGQSGIAFMMDRSRDVVIAMLAILKAGFFFVPLDPRHPKKRLQTIVDEADVKLIVTQEKYRKEAEALLCPLVVIEDMRIQQQVSAHALLQNGSAISQLAEVSALGDAAEKTAYVLFTSGSTGAPKGVVMRHQALSTTLLALGKSPPLPASFRFLHFGNYVFDVSIYEVFVTLLHGGTVCIPSEQERLDDLEGFMRRTRVTDAAMTPSTSRALDPERISARTSLRRLRLGGEVIDLRDRNRWMFPGSSVQLHCVYGITEACIANLDHVVKGPNEDPRVIGRPINCRTWIRNVFNPLELAPPGAIGELCLEGPGLAEGYLNDPVKTAAVFLHEPAWLPERRLGSPARSVYCTGDLAYFNPDTTLSFVRRCDSDHQVKIRGLRLDLRDIEVAIERACPSENHRVAVELLAPSGAQSYLCAAHFIANSQETTGKSSDLEGLQESLKQALPDYMVPRYHVFLDGLPINSVGKRDRRALRALMESTLSRQRRSDEEEHNDDADLVIPWTEEEQLLQATIRQVLNAGDQQRITKHTNFFSIGGDSIMTIRLVALLRIKGYLLRVVDVFENPTIAKMTASLRPANESDVALCPTRPGDDGVASRAARTMAAERCGVDLDEIEMVYPATAAQEMLLRRVVRFSFEVSRSHASVMKELPRAIKACVAQFPILRTRFIRSADRVTLNGGRHRAHLLQVVLKTKGDDDGVDIQSTGGSGLTPVGSDALTSYDSAKGPLHCFQIALNTGLLVWEISHSLYDGWSMRLMVQFINQMLQGKDTAKHTAAASCPFADYAEHENQSRNEKSHQLFWNSYLAKLPIPGPQLFQYAHTIDPVRNMSSTYRMAMPLNMNESSPSTFATILLAALARTVSDALSSRDILIAYVTTGRSIALPGIETCVGPTLSLIPLRIRLSARASQPDEGTVATAGATMACHAQLSEDARVVQCELNRVLHYEASATNACCKTEGASFPLELVMHPRDRDHQYQYHHCHNDNKNSQGDHLRAPLHDVDDDIVCLREVSNVSDVSGGFLLECSQHNGTFATMTARWDRRAAAKAQVDELVHTTIASLSNCYILDAHETSSYL
ncbi:hypothetical protein CBER1_11675 [Cercospora berteroae]|uniref:Carrier domain-containing protein n=1 Tax=Cercospora berteroae TaxID=357750 RepID=A0A2S6CH05_9PEZI|nr:hypothetical protein CBER1_11675 [Cercospora berteroae]